MKIQEKNKGIRIHHNKKLFWIILVLLAILIGILVYIGVKEVKDEEVIPPEEEFCGISSGGTCEFDDCVTSGCSGQVCQSKDEESAVTTCEFRECYDSERYMMRCACFNEKCMWRRWGRI